MGSWCCWALFYLADFLYRFSISCQESAVEVSSSSCGSSFSLAYPAGFVSSTPQHCCSLHPNLGFFVFLVLLVYSLSHAQLFVTPWTVAHQAPPSVGFPRQEYWTGLPFPSPGDLPHPGIKLALLLHRMSIRSDCQCLVVHIDLFW